MQWNDQLIFNLPFKDLSCRNKSSFYYITTHEGMMSHLHQIEDMWKAVQVADKCLVLFAFHSFHYMHGNISLCNYFNFPDDVYCLPMEYMSYFPNSLTCVSSDHTCRLINSRNNNSIDSSGSWQFQLENEQPNKYYGIIRQSHRLNILKSECSCGYFDAQTPNHVPRTNKNNSDGIYNTTQIFTNSLEEKFIQIKEILNISDTNLFLVAHWRRGDQKFLCNDGRDKSINCAADENPLIQSIEELVRNQCGRLLDKTYHRYVATNEKNQNVLDHLDQEGYITFQKIKTYNNDIFRNMSDIEEFLIEVMLSCEAHCYIGYGTSNFDKFTSRCRNIIQKKTNAGLITLQIG